MARGNAANFALWTSRDAVYSGSSGAEILRSIKAVFVALAASLKNVGTVLQSPSVGRMRTEPLAISLKGGRLTLINQSPDFRCFLATLKSLNRAVEIKQF